MKIGDLPLDVIGTMAGTDKGSRSNKYLEHYEAILSNQRQEVFTLLEIGIANGESLTTWKTYFPHAHIVGVDIDPKCARFAAERISVENGSQYDAEFMQTICKKYNPLVIIDDGSHIAKHQIFTFEKTFPFLRPGGIYIVEDVYFHAHSAVGDGPSDIVPENPIDYFLYITRYVLASEGMPDHERRTAAIDYAVHHVHWVRVFRGAVVIKKRGGMSGDVVTRNVAAAEMLASLLNLPERWHWASQLIMEYEGASDRAEAAVRRAIAGRDDASAYYRTLSSILNAKGDKTAAIDAMRMAVEVGHRSGDLIDGATSEEMLGDLFMQSDRREEARASYMSVTAVLSTADHSVRGIAPWAQRVAGKLARV